MRAATYMCMCGDLGGVARNMADIPTKKHSWLIFCPHCCKYQEQLSTTSELIDTMNLGGVTEDINLACS